MSKRINMSEVLGFTFHLMVYQVSHNNLVFNRKAWEKFLEDELQISETKYSESIINSLVLSNYLIKKDEEIYINKNKIMDEQKSIVKMFNRQKDYDLELRRYSLYEGNHFLDMVKLILIELEARGSHSYNEDYLYKAFREVSLPVNKRQLEEITLKLMMEGWILGNGYTKSIRVPVDDAIKGKIYAMFNEEELNEIDIIVSKYIGPTLMFNMNDVGMKKGFTLVEMLAVVLILGVIILVGVPIYQGIRRDTSESIYNSKIANVLSKAEKYTEEAGIFIYDLRYMIEKGLLTPDNEAGEYRDPRNGRSMLCDIVQVAINNNNYYANVDESNDCYSLDELQKMNSIVKIVFYRSLDGSEVIPDSWVKTNHVYAGYEFIGAPDVTNVLATWGGIQGEVVNNRLDIYTESILNTEVLLHIEFDYNGKHIVQDVSKNVRIDNERPRAIVVKAPGDEKSSNLASVTWRLTDGDGSGVAGHIILDEESFRSKPCESYTPDEIPGNDSTNVTKRLNNGVYYMCVKDKVGNITKNSDAEENRVEVKNVDQASGDIKSFKIESNTPPYQLMDVKLVSELNDSNISDYEMCVSNTGYIENCSWESYESIKNVNITGYDYGSNVVYYLAVRDSAGNISKKEASYTIDNLQYLDLNGQLNGENKSNLNNYGKCDVYVNGTRVGEQVRDYYQLHVPGSTYEIKNCTADTGYRYKDSTISGVIGRSGASSLYVKYVSLYTISYNMNGGSSSVASQTKEHGTNINLATTASTKTGYSYVGWNTNSAGTGTNYAAGASYSGNGNITLYAKWKLNKYTVTFNKGIFDSCSESSRQVSPGEEIGTLPTCSRKDYRVSGWWDNPEQHKGNQITRSTIVNGNMTIYPHWHYVDSDSDSTSTGCKVYSGGRDSDC